MEPIKKQEPQGTIRRSPHQDESPGTVGYIIQVGAFRKESLAMQLRSAFRKCCTAMLNLLHEGQFYKVQIPSLQEERGQRIPS